MDSLTVDVADVIRVTGLSGARLRSHQRRNADLIDMILQHGPPTGRILDVGCASGDIAVELAILGFDVHGIDLEP